MSREMITLELEVEALVSQFAQPETLKYLWRNDPSNLSNILILKTCQQGMQYYVCIMHYVVACVQCPNE